MDFPRLVGPFLSLLVALSPSSGQAEDGTPQFQFEKSEAELRILLEGQAIARYVFADADIPRPYFCDVKTPDGIQVTRNHPPVEGVDRTDHATYHPGLWMAFGDLGGEDFWRLKSRVEQRDLSIVPSRKKGVGSFEVINAYVGVDMEEVCREVAVYRFTVFSEEGEVRGYSLEQDSTFGSPVRDFHFGDQEEMGWGIRVATPISVKEGGTILNSDGLVDEEAVWGKTSDWCAYSGEVDGRWVGMTLMPHPENFRPSWFHARDYGLLVANPFGRNAFTDGAASSVEVRRGEPFRYRNGLFVYSSPERDDALPRRGYERYVDRVHEN